MANTSTKRILSMIVAGLKRSKKAGGTAFRFEAGPNGANWYAITSHDNKKGKSVSSRHVFPTTAADEIVPALTTLVHKLNEVENR